VSETRLGRHADFLRLWTGQTISQLGSQISLVAIPLTAVLVLHAGAFQVGLLSTFEYLAFLLVGLPAGVWVDRLPRRRVLIAADVGRTLALGSIPLASAIHHLVLLQLYAVALVVGVLTVFFDVAYQSYLPSLVSRPQLVAGNVRLELTRGTAEVAGPGIGGLLVGAVGAAVAVTADAVSYLASVISLLLIRGREAVERSTARRSLRTELGEGVRYVMRHRLLRWIAACTGISNLFSHMAMAILILYAVRELGLGAGSIGLWLSLGSIGGPVGAVAAARLARRWGVGPTIAAMAWVTFPAWLLVPLAPRAHPLPVLITAGMIGAAAGVVYNVNQVSLRQAITPQRLQGRMNATMRFLVWGTIPIGAFIGGVLGSAIGLRPTLFVAAAGQVLAALPVTFSSVRSIRSIEEEVDRPLDYRRESAATR
jgi:MFS family permease